MVASKQKKPKPKPVIEYPPVPTKKWIPPDQRKKPPRKPAYVKPEGISQKLEISSLQKVWHKYRILGDIAVLAGSYSQTHKRFIAKTNGYQGASNCVVACAFCKIYKMPMWSHSFINSILEHGNELYLKSILHNENKCKVKVDVEDVYTSFYMQETRITMVVGADKVKDRLSILCDQAEILRSGLEKFFSANPSGVIAIQDKWFAIWQVDGVSYIFSPYDNTYDGEVFKGFCGDGHAVVIRMKKLKLMATFILDRVDKTVSPTFIIHPVTILRIVKINTEPPEEVPQLSDEEKKLLAEKQERVRKILEEKKSQLVVEEPPPPIPQELLDQIDEISPDVVDDISLSKRPSWLKDATLTRQDIPKSKAPVEKPRKDSLTFFEEIVPENVAILRASTHQHDEPFVKFKGRQSLPMAIAALTMLRIMKSRHWYRQILDEIIKVGNNLCRTTLKENPDEEVDVKNISKIVQAGERWFTPEIEFVALGKVNSRENDILELQTALDDFLRDHDTCVIVGPVTLAVWVENGLFYMFDPNERDGQGKRIIYKTKLGSNIQITSPPGGKACVTWFKKVKDLVDLYIRNLEVKDKYAYFKLYKVVINDYTEKLSDWYEYTSLSRNKWILRGTFSQNSDKFSKSSRNVQSSANAVIALTYAKIKAEHDWDSETVDQVLLDGDKLYNKSVNTLQEKDKFKSPLLMVNEIDTRFQVADQEVETDVADCLVNGIVGASESSEALNLRKGFEEFFKDYETGVVTSHNISVAVWKRNEIYYYFDSHSLDEKGVVTSLGTACILRIMGIPELARAIETNFGPVKNRIYNISQILVNFLEKDEFGIVKPALNNFTMLDNLKAILRATLNEKSPKYEINAGKQTVPMCLMALGFNKLLPANTWTVDNLDEVLDLGNDYYKRVMSELLEEGYFLKDKGDKEVPEEPPKEGEENVVLPVEEEEEENKEDAVTSENVKKFFRIGLNLFEFELETVGEGMVEMNLSDAIKDYFGIITPEDDILGDDEEEGEGETEGEAIQPEQMEGQLEEAAEQEKQVPQEESPHPPPLPQWQFGDTKPEYWELLLETGTVTLSIWYDEKAFYLFDPRPRDQTGQVIGKDDWSAKHIELDEYFDYEDEYDEEDEPETNRPSEEHEIEDYLTTDDEFIMKPAGEKGAGDAPKAPPVPPIPEPEPEPEPVVDDIGVWEPQEGDEELEEEELGEEEEVEEFFEPIKEKHSSGYWRAKEKEEGKACTMWFVNPFDLINHIIDNTPPNKREEMPFKLSVVKMTNKPNLKEVFDPETEERRSVFNGDWYDFKEIEYGRWILRGKRNMDDPMFPFANQNKQAIPNCLAFLAFSHVYAMSKFKQSTIDTILKYGDRMYSYLTRMRRAELKKNVELRLTGDEIETIVANETYELKDFTKKFCVAEHKIEMDIQEDHLTGHLAAKEDDNEVWNLYKGLLVFFEAHRIGLLSCKGLTVAILRGEKLYYMFDSNRRGPKGIYSPNGVPCITRYLSLQKLVETFIDNLPHEGQKLYSIHNVEIKSCPCPRERHPKPEEEEEKDKVVVTSYKMIIPGKIIVKGTISQQDEVFGRGPNVQSASMAFVALSMSLIHKPRTWSKPIIDEIVYLGDQLYLDSIDELGFDYNPWEDYLDVYKVKTDFKIGIIRANVELRHADQKGIIDIKNSKTTQNLRQGLERFFEENTHGILITDTLTLAIWEEEEENGEPLIYMFDPNPRGPTGLPNSLGTACCLAFLNAKLASDHIIACIPDPSLREGEFVIVPVEVLVGAVRVGRRKKKGDMHKKKKMGDEHPTTKLPRCDPTLALEQKRELRKIAERQRKLKEEKRLFLLGRKEYYYLTGGEAVLRGLHSQNSIKFCDRSRGNQDIPNCIAAYVLSRVLDISIWNYKHIDAILDTGDQLYIDSYITYRPKDPKLGLKNILRTFFFKECEVEVVIFVPMVFKDFTSYNLQTTLISFFNQENACILEFKNQWLALFLKSGLYYVFDPHECDHQGNKTESGKGSAVVLRFELLESMCDKIFRNLTTPDETLDQYSLITVQLKSIRKPSVIV